MTHILMRLAARAKSTSPPPPDTGFSGLRPRMAHRFEGTEEMETSAHELAADPVMPATARTEPPQPSTPSPKSNSMGRQQTVTQQPPAPSGMNKPAQIDNNHPAPSAHAEKNLVNETPARLLPEKIQSEYSGNGASDFSADFSNKEQETAQQEPNKTNTETVFVQKTVATFQSNTVPERLQPIASSDSPSHIAVDFADFNDKSDHSVPPTPQAPDITIQIDRIEIQVEKSDKSPAARQSRKPQMTDLSSYLSGKESNG